jgi:hypothetical protein
MGSIPCRFPSGRERSRTKCLGSYRAAVGVAQEEDEEQGIDQQDIFDRVVSFLAAITLFLFNRVLGADDTPLGPVMGKRGEADAAADAATRGAASSSSGATTAAASASETPSRCASAVRERAGGGIAEGAQGRQQRWEEDVNPSIGFALHHPEQAPLHDLERLRFQGDQDKQEPIFRCRQGAVLVDGKPARGPRLPIHAPRRHPGVERRLEGWDQLLKLVERQAREIQERYRAGLQRGEPSTSHGSCLLSLSRDIRGASYQKESGINSNAYPPPNRRGAFSGRQVRCNRHAALSCAAESWCCTSCA